MTNNVKGKLLKGTAIAIDAGVPLTVAATQFPIWVEKSAGATVSGLFLIFAALACIPFFRQIKAWFKSPSAPVLWSVMFILMIVLRNIVDQMVIVCFFGMISNIAGSGLYKWGSYLDVKERDDGQT